MTEKTKDKRYNLTGTIQGLEMRKTTDGTDYAVFQLVREGKPAVKAIAFAEKCAELVGQFQNGSIAKLFGFYEKRQFPGQDGTTKISRSFKVLWSGEPKPAAAAAEMAAAA